MSRSSPLIFFFIEQFALTEVSYITIRLLQEFSHLESRDPEPWRERMTLVCSSLGMQVRAASSNGPSIKIFQFQPPSNISLLQRGSPLLQRKPLYSCGLHIFTTATDSPFFDFRRIPDVHLEHISVRVSVAFGHLRGMY